MTCFVNHLELCTSTVSYKLASFYAYIRVVIRSIDCEICIFTAIGTTISKRAEDVEKELESLLEKFYSLQSSDRELVEYKEKKFLITKKTSNEDKIAFLTEVYKENPDILDDAIKSICTKGNLHRWGPLVRRS